MTHSLAAPDPLDRPLPWSLEYIDPERAAGYQRNGYSAEEAEHFALRTDSFACSGDAKSLLDQCGATRYGLIRRRDIRSSGSTWAWTPEVWEAGEGGWEPLHHSY